VVEAQGSGQLDDVGLLAGDATGDLAGGGERSTDDVGGFAAAEKVLADAGDGVVEGGLGHAAKLGGERVGVASLTEQVRQRVGAMAEEGADARSGHVKPLGKFGTESPAPERLVEGGVLGDHLRHGVEGRAAEPGIRNVRAGRVLGASCEGRRATGRATGDREA
jgi:hypothetical protein